MRYTGSIHEQPSSELPRRDLAVRLAHDGYLPHQMQTKGERNLRLLNTAVHAHPRDAYIRYQLGKDLDLQDHFDAAAQEFNLALKLLGTSAGRQPGWRHGLVLRQLHALKASGRMTDALSLAEQEQGNWPDSQDFYFVLGDLMLELAIQNPANAPSLIPMICNAWEQCLRIGENPTLEGAVHGRGSHLAEQNLALLPATERAAAKA